MIKTFNVDDLYTSLQVKDFQNINPPIELSKCGAFKVLNN
ncbi:hypothetical protein Lser_V15G03453 [Lactuca serriola]